jgi:uncharacterized protein (TIGR03067 family)
MRRPILLLVLLSLPLAARAAPAPKPKPKESAKDKDSILGTWQVTEAIREGTKVSARQLEGAAMAFRNGRCYIVEKGRKEMDAGPLTIDPSKSPRTIDLRIPIGPGGPRTWRGIYELKGDALKIALGDPQKGNRPTTFVSQAGNKTFLIVLKRKGKR